MDCPAAEFNCADLNDDSTVSLVDFGIFALLYGSVPSGMVPDCLP